MTHPTSQSNSSGPMSVIGSLLSLVLFVIAILAWMQTKSLTNNISKNWSDPLAKEPNYKLAMSAQTLTFLLWVAPLLLALLSFVFWMYKGSKGKAERVDKLYQKKYVAGAAGAGVYHCAAPRYIPSRPY